MGLEPQNGSWRFENGPFVTAGRGRYLFSWWAAKRHDDFRGHDKTLEETTQSIAGFHERGQVAAAGQERAALL